MLRAELSALEARMRSAIRDNNAQFTRHVSTGDLQRASVMDSDNMLTEQVETVSRDLISFSARLKQLENRNSQLNSEVARLSAAMAGAGVLGR